MLQKLRKLKTVTKKEFYLVSNRSNILSERFRRSARNALACIWLESAIVHRRQNIRDKGLKMRSRMIHEGSWLANALSALSHLARVIYITLLLLTDTAGNGPANPAIIKCHAFAYHDDITIATTAEGIKELANADIIYLYEVDGEEYYHLNGFERQQTLRYAKHEFPLPDGTPPDVANRRARQLRKRKTSTSTSESEIETEVEAEEEVESEVKTKAARAASRTAQARLCPPTTDEVSKYCLSEGIDVNASRFVDYYTSKGWTVGNQPMIDWKAAVRRWASNDAKITPRTKAEWGFEDFVNR